jgi:hypothetical protein
MPSATPAAGRTARERLLPRITKRAHIAAGTGLRKVHHAPRVFSVQIPAIIAAAGMIRDPLVMDVPPGTSLLETTGNLVCSGVRWEVRRVRKER